MGRWLINLVNSNKQWLFAKFVENVKKEQAFKYLEGYEQQHKKSFDVLSRCISYLLKENDDIINEIILENSDKYEFIINDFLKMEHIGIRSFFTGRIDVSTLLRIVKCFRRAYMELLAYSECEEGYKLKCCNFLERFFDVVENMTCSEWSKENLGESNFNVLTEITSAFVFMYDDKKILYANPAMEKFTAYTSKELYKIDLRKMVHPEFLDKVDWFCENKMKSTDAITYEIKILTKYGEEKWIGLNIGSLYIGNKPIIMGIAFDIDKRKKTEEALKDSEKRYRKLVELMPDAVYLQEGDTITYANKAAAKLLGVQQPEVLLGKKIYDVLRVHPDCHSIVQQQNDRIIRTGSLSLMERKYIRQIDGKILEVEMASSVMSNNDATSILHITRDIAERKKTEKLKEKIKEKTKMLKQTMEHEKIKTEFFANISHELRTPLNVILGALQLLDLIDEQDKIEENKEKIKRYKEMMKQNCYRLVRLVNNIIDVTKIDAGYFELKLENINIINIVEDISLSVAAYIESKGIKLIFDTEVEEKVIACDIDKVERILLNLLSNAIKFTGKGGYIYVNIYDKKDKLIISVEDTGIGIPIDKQKAIFERFIQVDKSLSREREGSGIGLSLVKSLVEMQKGHISLTSECGKGSKFIIEFPCNTINADKKSKKDFEYITPTNIERINIEFSDIYA